MPPTKTVSSSATTRDVAVVLANVVYKRAGFKGSTYSAPIEKPKG
jgi:hypothetical protein